MHTEQHAAFHFGQLYAQFGPAGYNYYSENHHSPK